MKHKKILTAAGLVLFLTAANAQQPTSAPGTGTVTGHVTCGDTQRPARFAAVVLFGVPAKVTPAAKPNPGGSADEQMAAVVDALATLGKTNMVQTQTGVDGTYVLTDVVPGDYYAFGGAPGYISPLNQVQAAYNAGADLKARLPGVPIVHVVAEHQSNVDVTIDRGAAISGVISWNDGSPVTGANVTITPAKGETKTPQQYGMLAMAGNLLGLLSVSDDLGHFRVSGLAPGDYVVQASIKAGQQMGLGSAMNLSKMMAATPLVVYAPSAFHKNDAKPVTLHTAEDRRDFQMTLNLSALHSVSGRVASVEDHHGINSATVKLVDDQDKEFVRTAPVDAAGNFTVTFVPPGTYSMKVVDAEDTEPKPKTDKDKPNIFGPGTKTIRSYVNGNLSVLVTDSDVIGQNVDLAVDKNPKSEQSLEKLLENDDPTPAPKP